MAKIKNSAKHPQVVKAPKFKPFKAGKMAKIERVAQQSINPDEKALASFKFPGKGGKWQAKVKHLSNHETDMAEILLTHKKSNRQLVLHICDVGVLLRIYVGSPEVVNAGLKIEASKDFLRAVGTHAEHTVNMTASNTDIVIVSNKPEPTANPEPGYAQMELKPKRKPARKRAATNSKAYAEQHKDAIIDIHTKLLDKFGVDKDFGLAEIKDIIADQYAHPGPVASAIAIGMEYLGLLTRKRDNTSHRVVCRLTGLTVTAKEAEKGQ